MHWHSPGPQTVWHTHGPLRHCHPLATFANYDHHNLNRVHRDTPPSPEQTKISSYYRPNQRTESWCNKLYTRFVLLASER